MRFVYPEFLWALFALLIPVIIHLFNFRRYNTLYFSSLQFIRHGEQTSNTTQRLMKILILVLRLLAFSLLIIAFAQPYFPFKSGKNTGGDDFLAIHIDNSFSMTMKGVEGELLSESKEAVREILTRTPQNTRILLSTNALDGIESHITTKIEALDRLDQIQASPMVRSYDEVIRWQKQQIESSKTQLNGSQKLIYLSDFQKNTTSFKKLKPDTTASYIPIFLRPQNNTNISIDSAWFTSPLHKIGVNNELNFKLTNHSDEDLQNIQVHFSLGNINRDIFMDLPQNSSVNSMLNYSDTKNGFQHGKLSIQDKQFYSDDEYYFSYKVAEKSSILVINGDDAARSIASIYKLDAFYDVTEISQGSYTQSNLENKNLVVLNGINDIPSGLEANLIDFAQNGGTIAVFLGKSPTFSSINKLLNDLELPVISKKINQSSRINRINYKDPFFKGVFDKEKENLSLPGISQFFLTSETGSTKSVEIINLQNGKPLFLRTNSDIQSFLFTSVLSPEFGSFTSDILYTTLLLRIGELSLRNAPISITIGETTNYPIYGNKQTETAIHIIGNEIDFIPRMIQKGNTSYLDLSGSEAVAALTAGIYDIKGIQNLGQMAVNYNRNESKVANYTSTEVMEKLKEAGILSTTSIEIVDGASTVDFDIEKNYPYWKIVLIFALLCLLAEMLIIKFWNKKKLQVK